MTEQFIPLEWMVNEQYPPQDHEQIKPVTLAVDGNSTRTTLEQLMDAFGGEIFGEESGFSLNADDSLTFPGLPPVMPIGMARHGLERIYVYPANFIVVAQLGGKFTVLRHL